MEWKVLVILVKMRSFFVKIGIMVADLSSNLLLWPNWPKSSYSAPDPWIDIFFQKILYCSKVYKIWFNTSSWFWRSDYWLRSYWCFTLNIIQETTKILVFWCHFMYVYSPRIVKILFFVIQKMKYLRNCSSNFKNQTHSEILLLRAFKWAVCNWLLFEKVQILVWTPYYY